MNDFQIRLTCRITENKFAENLFHKRQLRPKESESRVNRILEWKNSLAENMLLHQHSCKDRTMARIKQLHYNNLYDMRRETPHNYMSRKKERFDLC